MAAGSGKTESFFYSLVLALASPRHRFKVYGLQGESDFFHRFYRGLLAPWQPNSELRLILTYYKSKQFIENEEWSAFPQKIIFLNSKLIQLYLNANQNNILARIEFINKHYANVLKNNSS